MSSSTVGEVCSRKFVTVPRRRRVVEVSRIIASRWVSCVIVTEERRPVGIVTKHSLVRDVLARGYTGMELTAGDIMRSPIVSIGTQASLEEAAGLMAATRIRYLAVTDEGRLVGLLSHYHIARLLPTLLRQGVNSGEDQAAATPGPS
ncbi:MAG: CBS domain-containing protein [Actinobacteria bacterium]|nr:CBS domain-containing protein [Actinomycetota bacterium]